MQEGHKRKDPIPPVPDVCTMAHQWHVVFRGKGGASNKRNSLHCNQCALQCMDEGEGRNPQPNKPHPYVTADELTERFGLAPATSSDLLDFMVRQRLLVVDVHTSKRYYLNLITKHYRCLQDSASKSAELPHRSIPHRPIYTCALLK